MLIVLIFLNMPVMINIQMGVTVMNMLVETNMLMSVTFFFLFRNTFSNMKVMNMFA